MKVFYKRHCLIVQESAGAERPPLWLKKEVRVLQKSGGGDVKCGGPKPKEMW